MKLDDLLFLVVVAGLAICGFVAGWLIAETVSRWT